MKPLMLIQNDANVPPGHLAGALDGLPGGYEIRRLFDGDPVPNPAECGAIGFVLLLWCLMVFLKTILLWLQKSTSIPPFSTAASDLACGF